MKIRHTTTVTNSVDGAYDPKDHNKEEERKGPWSIEALTKGVSRTGQCTTPDQQTARHPPHQANDRTKRVIHFLRATLKRKSNTNARNHAMLQRQQHAQAGPGIPRKPVGRGGNRSIATVFISPYSIF